MPFFVAQGPRDYLFHFYYLRNICALRRYCTGAICLVRFLVVVRSILGRGFYSRFYFCNYFTIDVPAYDIVPVWVTAYVFVPMHRAPVNAMYRTQCSFPVRVGIDGRVVYFRVIGNAVRVPGQVVVVFAYVYCVRAR